MVIVTLLIFSILFGDVAGYENIAFGKPTTMSGVHTRFGGHLTNDGDKRNSIYMNSNSCSHTQEHLPEAWWQVDLENIYPITNIEITYRSGLTKRLAGFSIFVSNTSSFKDGEECYHYTSTNLPPAIKNWTCIATGRYVTIYNERNASVTYPPSYSKINIGAILELCEVEVFGCPYSRYGTNCDEICFCSSFTCNYKTGICSSGCKEGYSGESCNRCATGNYGENCENCGNCKLDMYCDSVTGACPAGCKEGWKPPTCSEVCEKGTFGTDCSQKCGSCLNGESCDHVNGTCKNGCAPGFIGNICNNECEPGRYGDSCNGQCGECKKYTNCDPVNGYCIYGCEDGWQQPSCKNICANGTFGRNCNNQCGTCMNEEPCNHVTGICTVGCKVGFLGERCDKVCERGNHGLDCKDNCGNCYRDEACHHNNGSCPNGCEPGWQEPLCVTCVPGYFGPECLDKCGHCFNEVPCDQVTGECLNGCKDGWNGSRCEYKVVYNGIKTIYVKRIYVPSVVIPCSITVLVIIGCILVNWKIYRQKQKLNFKLTFTDVQKNDNDGEKGTDENDISGSHDNAYEGLF